jgi:ubiquinol-cytochrome c reductase iron-sulfur subunit
MSHTGTQSKTGMADDGRRDFLILATAATGAIGAVASVWPLVDSMNPAADVRALSTVEVDIGPVKVGQRITVKWRGKPVFIGHRSPREIARAKADDAADLPDPELDRDRVQKDEWLIVIGVCTHLGCIPIGQRSAQSRGQWGGWFCPCHGSHYDTSGRIRKGPAPENLYLPEYKFVEDLLVRIG